MRLVRVVSPVSDGRPVAWYGNRRLYADDFVEYSDEGTLPKWATVAKKADPAKIKRAGPVREVFNRVGAADLARGEPLTNREIQAAHRASDSPVI